MKTLNYNIRNMVCNSCEDLIRCELQSLNGVTFVKASLENEEVIIKYDESKISEKEIIEKLKHIGYPLKSQPSFGLIPLIIFGLIFLLLSKSTLFNFDFSELLSTGSLIIIFFIGILSSFHCVGMCGGIMLTQTLNKKSNIKSSILYNLGRLISYTILGGTVGALGSVFTLTPKLQGIIQILAALFMLITALNMLNIPILKKLRLNIPIKCSLKNRSTNSFVVGILNGLMPCGPLQTMQIYALSTGSFYLGAISMFTFALGTIPLMLAFGSISTILSKKYSNEIIKFSGIFLIILSLIMVQRGFALVGFNTTNSSYSNVEINDSIPKESLPNIVNGVQEITLNATNSTYYPKTLIVEKNKPVKLNINSENISFCTNRIVFPSLDIEKTLYSGETASIEFTPTEEGEIPYSCWMGMRRGSITVVDSLDDTDNIKNYNPTDYNSEKYDLDKYLPEGLPGGFPACH